jgi:hypothetical protein
MIEEIEPILVDAGLVNLAYVIGMFAGGVITFMLLYAIDISNKSGFRHYYHEIDDDSRKEIDGIMNSLNTNIEFLSLKTNTRYFKTWHNRFISFTAYLKQRRLQS